MLPGTLHTTFLLEVHTSQLHLLFRSAVESIAQNSTREAHETVLEVTSCSHDALELTIDQQGARSGSSGLLTSNRRGRSSQGGPLVLLLLG